MGGQAQDGEEPLAAGAPSALGLVSAEPAPTDRSSTPDAQAEAARPLRVLWDHRKLPQSPGIPGGSEKDLATLALAASPRWRDPLVGLPSTGATLRPTQTASGPQPVAQRSEIISEEPGARDVQARICGGPGWATTQVYPAREAASSARKCGMRNSERGMGKQKGQMTNARWQMTNAGWRMADD